MWRSHSPLFHYYYYYYYHHYFGIIIDSHVVSRNNSEKLCTLYPFSLNYNILQNSRTVLHTGYWHFLSRWWAISPPQGMLALTFCRHTYDPPCLWSPANNNLFTTSILLSFKELCMNGIIQQVTFSNWLKKKLYIIHPNCYVYCSLGLWLGSFT